MNILSFIDELVKVGAARSLLKVATDGPYGLTGPDAAPPSDLVLPAEASTRLKRTAGNPSSIIPGHLGDVSSAKNPIDRERFNRSYREKS